MFRRVAENYAARVRAEDAVGEVFHDLNFRAVVAHEIAVGDFVGGVGQAETWGQEEEEGEGGERGSHCFEVPISRCGLVRQ